MKARQKGIFAISFIVFIVLLLGCRAGDESKPEDQTTGSIEPSAPIITPSTEAEEPLLSEADTVEMEEPDVETTESASTPDDNTEQPATDLDVSTESAIQEAPTAFPADPLDQGLSYEPIPNWKVGDKVAIELIKERIDSDQGITQLEMESRTPVEILVVDRSDDGCVLQWTYGKTVIEGAPIVTDPTLEVLLGLTEGMRVEYEVDLFGTPTDLRNWEEIRLKMEEALAVTIGYLENQGLNQSELQQIRGLIEPMFSSKEQIEAFATKEILQYHLIYGWPPFETSAPMSYEDLLPNTFGGDPFPSIARFELVNYEPGAVQVTINWFQTLDPDSARRILMQSLVNMAAAMGADPPTEDDLPSPFAIEDTATYVIDTHSGWVVSAEHVREIVIGPSVRVESTKMVAGAN